MLPRSSTSVSPRALTQLKPHQQTSAFHSTLAVSNTNSSLSMQWGIKPVFAHANTQTHLAEGRTEWVHKVLTLRGEMFGYRSGYQTESALWIHPGGLSLRDPDPWRMSSLRAVKDSSTGARSKRIMRQVWPKTSLLNLMWCGEGSIYIFGGVNINKNI